MWIFGASFRWQETLLLFVEFVLDSGKMRIGSRHPEHP
jgi:hypothetical protein